MFRHRKFKALTAAVVLIAMCVQPFVACAGTGATQDPAPEPVLVKLVPVAVSADTSTLPPKLADAENEAVWRLFDRDTSSTYTPTKTTRITVSLAEPKAIGRLRVYGAPSYQLNVYRDSAGGWESVPSLSGVSLEALNRTSWNNMPAESPFTTTSLLLEFIPQGNVTAGIPELELWGPVTDTSVTDTLRTTLEGIRTPREAYDLLALKAPHIIEIPATPSEITVPDGSADDSVAVVNFNLTGNPSLFKRAYILYEGNNISTPVELQKRINNLSWTGGFAVSRPAGAEPAWAPLVEEINPAWLVQGENSIKFRSPKGQSYIRNLRLIVETDSGWNSVASVSSAALVDGDPSTSYEIHASAVNPAVQINFERPVEPEKIRLHVHGPTSIKVALQYSTGDSWQDVKQGWHMDLSSLQPGWNEIALPAKVSTTALRLVFNTGSLRLKTGVSTGSIDELRVCASPAGTASVSSRIVVSYPREGEFFGRTAYIQGFATPAADVSSQTQVDIAGKSSANPEGSFSMSLTKDEAGFFAQADDEAWSAAVKSEYAGQAGMSLAVPLTRNYGNVTAAKPVKESREDAPFIDKREKYSEKVAPGQAKKIRYKGVTLDIPEDAVDHETEISIIPLGEADLARLNPGMINVTYPDAGYRFLPHGMKFKKPIRISFGYSKSLLAAGQTDNDVSMYFYNESLLQWQPLTRASVDAANVQVVSESDHFTDIINSTLVVPEHPQALSFNPNSIKDIKAADPTANVNLIEPPKVNNRGTANLSYPIEVPPGRNKIQPSLALQYNSGGGNGWMGIGWDLPVQSISIDTRWGGPRYDGAFETETYTLDGEQLTPLAHRGEKQPRSEDKVFHTRVEGQFRKIVRHGTAPNNYWWEVTDKNGTRYFYGRLPNGNSDAVLADPANGNVFKWALRQVRDANGNTMNYSYTVVANTGLANGTIPGYQLYLKKIDYTGHDDKIGAYTVVFKRDRELPNFTQRRDVTIDARSGFKMVTADLLRSVEVYFGGAYSDGLVLGGSLIRRYEFRYNEDAYGDHRQGTAFSKTLLTSVAQYGKDGGLFNTHTFTYYDEARNSNGRYHGFATPQDWSVGSDGVSVGLFNYGDASAVGGTEGSSIGGHLYLGVGPPGKLYSKENTGGAKIGYSESSSESVLTMADMDGDGLPDKVFKGGGGFYYRKNLSGPHGGNIFSDKKVPLVGLTAISREKTTSMTYGLEEYFVGTSGLRDTNKATTKADTYFADVNGDGLTDLVSGGHVLFGYLNAKKEPVFDANSTLTPVPIGSGTIDTNGLLEDPAAEEAERAAKFPLIDTVRRWVAPYDGTVSITAPVSLIQGTSEERAKHDGADGVQVAIQLEGTELWSTRTAQVADPRDPRSARLLADDYSTHTPTGVGGVQVKRGDKIYFRVQSVFDGAIDRVEWNPQITYLDSDTGRTDVNGLASYVYRASREFTLAGRQSSITMPLTGTLHIEGSLSKNGPTTDDATIVILRNGSEVYRHGLGAADSSSLNVSQDLTVSKSDELQVKILVDSPIDASLITFAPTAYYTAASGLDTVKNEKGEYMVTVSLPYSMDLYPADDLSAPQESWKAHQTGELAITPSLAFGNGISFANGASDAQVVFTVKKRGMLLGKGSITIGKDANGSTQTPLTLSVPVTRDDELFFDFSSRDTSILQYLSTRTVQVSYAPQTFEAVPSAFHSAVVEGAFPAQFRGWGAIGYNGNAPRDAQPIDQSLLVIDESFNPKSKDVMVYPFLPVPASSSWGGLDDGAWVKAFQASSSRLGLDDIRLPRSEDFSGAAAPSRISKSENDFTSVSYGGVGAGYSTGKSESKLDFIDLNGDRFPDVVSQGGVQFTKSDGALDSSKKGDVKLGTPRSNDNKTYQGSLNPGSIAGAIANSRGDVAPDGGGGSSSGAQGSEMPTFSFDGSYGTSSTGYDLIDINGDGLADKVYQNGAVYLNLGYSFSPDTENWGGGIVNDGQTLNGGVGLSLGYNQDSYSIAGGLGLSLGSTRSDETYVDINGDGLPDKVIAGSPMTVRLNQGGSFSGPIDWPGGQSKIAEDAHINLSGGVYFTIGFQVWVIRIVINPGVSFSNSIGRPEYAFRDMDGDGFVDHVYSDKDNKLSVATNPIGRTNLLKTVTRPLGGSFALEYTREGNSYEMPQTQWLLTNVSLTDGMGRSYRTGYAYFEPHQDRFEREFFGFARVEENQAPGTNIARTITESFNNRDYYLKGLLEKSVTSDRQGNVWAQKINSYVLADVADGSRFPQLQRTDTFFYDGRTNEDGYKKSTYQTFAYDQYGEVTAFHDAGELSAAADDVTATITYWSNPQQLYMRKPDTITVYGAGNNVLRKRWTTYENGTGNMNSHTSLIRANQNATWKIDHYDNYGNILTITDPVGYTLTYDYDADTATYVTRIHDNFSPPYWSTAGYNPSFGLPVWTRDLNGRYEVRGYDEFGRLATVHGPYDTDRQGNPLVGLATLAFEYKAPVLAVDGENLIAPAGAVTRNKAASRVGSNGNTLDTVIYADGLKRVLQTKKEADVEGRYGMVASGLITYDELGRTIEQGQPVFQSGGDLYGYVQLQNPKNPTKTAYDPLDRVVSLQTPDSQAQDGYAVTTTTYGFGQVNNSGLLYATTKVVDPIGSAAWEANRKGTKVSYKDVDERIAAVVEFNNGAPITTTYDYDPLGQITLVKDGRGNRTTVEYDMVGRRTAIVNPDTGRTEYGYDANGNLTSKLTANYQRGKEIKYDYTFNRLTRINYPYSRTVEYEYGPMGDDTYNRAGRIAKVSDESGTEERYYGNLGETTKEVKSVYAKTPAASRKVYTTDYVFDSFGRMLQMTYPDGENLYYAYDNGGLLNAAWGEKRGNRYNYISSLTYDEFGQRRQIAYGNGVSSSYNYDDKTRRLASLLSQTPDGRIVQNMSYGYDLVGNVLRIQNAINTPTNTALPAGPVAQVLEYDDLYQLKSANGEYAFGPGKQNLYSNEFIYDTIGNFTRKSQINKILQPSAAEHLPKETNYLLDYKYASTHPHAVTDAGDKLYSYDNNGNMTGWQSKTSGQRRTIIWNEENRVKEIQDNGRSTYFLYDDQGERVLKRGQHGETFYINRFYSIRNGELGTKSIYAGNTRVVSKLVKTPNTVTDNTVTATTSTTPGINGLDNGQGRKLGIIRRLNGTTTTTAILPPEEKDQFFYHGDHLGSSNMITDAKGAIYQHLEYFPYGETWIEEGGSYGGNTPGYKFTGKELDPETGLYYFGARYYEPVISRWISADPILGKYLPDDDDEHHTLPGLGGVYNPVNINLYGYAGQNPAKYTDPDGQAFFVPFLLAVAGAYIYGELMTPNVANAPAPGGTLHANPSAFEKGTKMVTGASIGYTAATAGARAAVKEIADEATGISSTSVKTKAWKQTISGSAHATKTPGHVFRSNKEAIKMAKSGKYDRVHMNQGMKKITGKDVKPNIRPDVAGVRKTGEVDVVEVASKSDTPAKLMNRNLNAQKQLPSDMRGNVDVVKPSN